MSWAFTYEGRALNSDTKDINTSNSDNFFSTKHTLRLEKYKNEIECADFQKYYEAKDKILSLLSELNNLETSISEKYPLISRSPLTNLYRYGGSAAEKLEVENESILKELVFYINSKQKSMS